MQPFTVESGKKMKLNIFAALVKQAADQFDESIPEGAVPPEEQVAADEGGVPAEEAPVPEQGYDASIVEQVLGGEIMDAAAQGVPSAIQIVSTTAAEIAVRMMQMQGEQAPEQVPTPEQVPVEGGQPAAPQVSATPEEAAVAESIAPTQAQSDKVSDQTAPAVSGESESNELEVEGLDPNKSYSAQEVLELLKAKKNASN